MLSQLLFHKWGRHSECLSAKQFIIHAVNVRIQRRGLMMRQWANPNMHLQDKFLFFFFSPVQYTGIWGWFTFFCKDHYTPDAFSKEQFERLFCCGLGLIVFTHNASMMLQKKATPSFFYFFLIKVNFSELYGTDVASRAMGDIWQSVANQAAAALSSQIRPNICKSASSCCTDILKFVWRQLSFSPIL